MWIKCQMWKKGEIQLYIFEDNEAVIKMVIKGGSPTMRHVSRTHRVALDLLFDRFNSEPMIQIEYVETKTNSLTYEDQQGKPRERTGWREEFSGGAHEDQGRVCGRMR